MRDHNETYDIPEHDEHTNVPAMTAGNGAEPLDARSFTPWGGDNFEEGGEEPCLAA